MKSKFTLMFQTTYQSIKIGKSVSKILTVLAILLLFSNCLISQTSLSNNPTSLLNTPTISSNDKAVEDIVQKDQVHVTFSGGGWRAHTVHSGWIISLLKNGDRSLEEAFTNVGTISANSGGSWFSTMLMFSKKFNTDISASNAIKKWKTPNGGWLGKQEDLFKKAPCNNIAGKTLELACVFDTYTHQDLVGATYWNLLVKGLVFNGYSLGDIKLNGERQAWAANKSLLLAGSMLTNTVVLNKTYFGLSRRYYQTCLSPNTPVLKGHKGSYCSAETLPDVTPVTFSSLPKTSSLNPSPFLAQLGTNTNSSKFNMGYTKSYRFFKAPKVETTIQLPISNEDLPVQVAAAASSSALGAGASEHITGSFIGSGFLEHDALSFQLSGSTAKFIDTKGMSLKKLAKKKVIRVSDGGTVDNSGVAQLVRFLQINNKADDFNIIAFDDTKEAKKSGKAYLGNNLAGLFGRPVSFGALTISVKLPKLQIFDKTALTTTSSTWIIEGEGGRKLIYTKYQVKTIDNPALGISAGTTGTLHAFSCVFPDADTAPTNGLDDFKAYGDMLDFIYNGLKKKNGEKLKSLEAAMGI